MTDDNVTSTSLLFQLHFRDKLTDEIIDTVKNTSDEQDKKTYLMGIIFGLIADNDWNVGFNGESWKAKINKWIGMRGQFIGPSEQQASSSSGGKSFSQSVAEGAKEGVKQVAKAAAVKAGEILIKKAFGV